MTLYQGKPSAMVGNGNLAYISHIGSKIVSSNSRSLHLPNILHVPQIPQRLMSVSHLCRDNHAFIEFNSDFFVVKDKTTKHPLLKRPMNQGLYKRPSQQCTYLQIAQPNPTFHSQPLSSNSTCISSPVIMPSFL